jgi:hypothetical protein
MNRGEEVLYPVVERYLKDSRRGLGCFETAQKKGNRYLGLADVIGLKHIGSNRSNAFEVLVVEVKRSIGSFGKKVGEALGYSLFAHRCYLAAPVNFTAYHRHFAAQLGVGLLQIRGKACYEVVTAVSRNPNEHQMLDLLESMKLTRCSLCGALAKSPKGGVAQRAALAARKDIPWVLHRTLDKSGKLCLCAECVKGLYRLGRKDEETIQALRSLTRSGKIWKLFKELRKFARDLHAAIEERPTKYRLAFALGRNFLWVYPKRGYLAVRILGTPDRVRIYSSSELRGIKEQIRRAIGRLRTPKRNEA